MAENVEETFETVMDTDTKTALCEVVALQGASRFASDSDREDKDAAAAMVEESPIVRLANTFLQSAIKEGASHIHIEPDRQYTLVRFRIDGVLHELMQMPNYIKHPLTQRYKYLAGVNIIEYRVPQQGIIGVRYDGNVYNMVANFLPALYGERIVLRIADARQTQLTLDQLGFTLEMQARLENLLIHPRGMLLIAGSTGSGKTTTQYILLDRLNTIENGTFAVSDYYEYTPGGITQARLNPRIGYTADAALRSIADLDADVVAVDQAHDMTTLATALQMAASGALMLSTLDAADAVTALRLLHREANADLLAENLSGILAQKLARRVCYKCKEYYEVPANELRRFGYASKDPGEMVQLARGAGCELCRSTGYKGRIALFELLTMNDALADIVARRASKPALVEAVKAGGMKDLREDGLIKILQGITTPEEVLRVVSAL